MDTSYFVPPNSHVVIAVPLYHEMALNRLHYVFSENKVVVVIMKVNGNDVMKTECKAVVTYCRE
jgi:hypothetical protein